MCGFQGALAISTEHQHRCCCLARLVSASPRSPVLYHNPCSFCTALGDPRALLRCGDQPRASTGAAATTCPLPAKPSTAVHRAALYVDAAARRKNFC